MKTPLYFFTFLAMSLITTSALAVTPDVTIVNTVTQAMAAAASNTIMPHAIAWLGTFMGLQFFITNFSLLINDNEIGTVIVKITANVAWFGICAYLLYNGPAFIDDVGNGMLTKYAPNIPGPGSVITSTLALCTAVLIGVAATGTSIAGVGNSSIAMVLVYALFIIFFIGLYIAIKIHMLHLELGLIVMLAPLSFSFLGLKALKDQGIAPFKSLISLIYRIIVLGIICAAFSEVVDVAAANLDKLSWKNPFDWAAKVNVIFSMISAFPVLAFLVYKSDSIASSLASGSTNMGTGDVAAAAAAGAAMAATGGTAAAAGVNAGTNAIQSMSSFMQGSGGDVSNASARGSGQTPSQAPSRAASMSTASGGAVGSSSAGGARDVAASKGSPGSVPIRPASAGASSPGAAPSAYSGAESNTAAAAAGGEAVSAREESSVGGTVGLASNDGAPPRASGSAPMRPGVSDRGASGGAPVREESGSNASSGPGSGIGASTGSGGGVSIPPASAGASSPGAAPSSYSGTASNTAASGDAPVREESGSNAGSGASAGIGAPLEQKLDKLTDVLLKQAEQASAPKKASLGERMGDLNRHLEKEKATTGVSINMNQTD
ncbi:hypothetical protein [Janthinobacterium sp. CAN_S7]|uniref:hypothetical protein n=1 Tax=Janthinobacterium sp. CAN_S7 TaxID=3071704 RepID=UPI00319D9073